MRTSARMTGAVAAAAVAALLVSGCGSGDDGDGEGDGEKASAKPTPTAEKTAGDDKADGEKAGDGEAELPGVWSTRAGGQKLTLTVVGDAVSLLREQKMCSGRVMESAEQRALVLKCPGGIGEERTNGEVAAVTAKTLKVTWNGGDTDTYTRLAKAPARLPEDAGELDELPDLPGKLKEVTEEPGKVREYPGN